MNKAVKLVTRMLAIVLITAVCYGQENDQVTMNFDRTDLRTVLNILGQMKPSASLIIDEGVEGEVTVNIKDVPWEKAMDLVLKPRGYTLISEGNNIYRVTKQKKAEKKSEFVDKTPATNQAETTNQDLVVTLMTPQELADLPLPKARQLIGYKSGDAPKNEAEIRRALADSPFPFVKELSSHGQPASQVINELAKKAGVSFSISQKFEKSTYSETIVSDVKDDETAPEAPVFEESDVNLTIKYLKLSDAFDVIAEQGGYAVRFKKGIWKFVPAPPDQQEPLTIEVYPVKYIKANDSLLASLSGGLTRRGSIRVLDKKSILVKDTEAAIDQVRRILEAIDKPIPQVQVEVRFYEINVTSSEEAGFNWEQMLSTNGISMHTSAWYVKNGNIYNGIPPRLGPGYVDGAVLTIESLDPVLKALNKSGQATQLSNPKIVVASGEQATVHIGDQIPMVKESADQDEQGNVTVTVELDDTFGGENTQSMNLLDDKKNIAPQRSTYSGYLDVGTILTVAPSVKSDEDVYVKIIPELLAADFANGFSKVNDTFTVQYPKLSKTTVYTEFMLKSGQTAAIGGLVKDDTSEVEDKVPFFGDIPYFGSWFTYSKMEKTKKEVLIFVTVKIIDTKNLDATAGIPAKARHAQKEVEDVRNIDAHGAEYIEKPDEKLKEKTPKFGELGPAIIKAIDESAEDGIIADIKNKTEEVFGDKPATEENTNVAPADDEDDVTVEPAMDENTTPVESEENK